eukprot:CAMPEP_0204181648 /NCGR_PEP_ID=MMETSP0361-20130328/52103_1 /ASSEMBLY_ACC=CAM_ASM_000343 /TAXON_ID=268821 /ORGANISM="Scrippsiella Hangoei, Strain SHTV-5" /LENGTH=80 /DNA_ID=CAMNT_0051141251 /DNA_START=74 /DNA_END=316 /DNA_ORIENTATION=+
MHDVVGNRAGVALSSECSLRLAWVQIQHRVQGLQERSRRKQDDDCSLLKSDLDVHEDGEDGAEVIVMSETAAAADNNLVF